MSGLDDLERRLAARVSAPDEALRGRVLDALVRERRREQSSWSLLAAAAWLAVAVNCWSARPDVTPPESSSGVRALLARGPDFSLVPRLARPVGLDRWLLP